MTFVSITILFILSYGLYFFGNFVHCHFGEPVTAVAQNKMNPSMKWFWVYVVLVVAKEFQKHQTKRQSFSEGLPFDNRTYGRL